jgi:hypothetical protein
MRLDGMVGRAGSKLGGLWGNQHQGDLERAPGEPRSKGRSDLRDGRTVINRRHSRSIASRPAPATRKIDA